MSTELESESNTESESDTQASSNNSEMNAHRRVEAKRQLAALEDEADHLQQFQQFARIHTDWDSAVAESFHSDLVRFLSAAGNQQESLGLAEIAIALWDELSRIEHTARETQSEDSADADADADAAADDNDDEHNQNPDRSDDDHLNPPADSNSGAESSQPHRGDPAFQ
jgi:hypothetical protein